MAVDRPGVGVSAVLGSTALRVIVGEDTQPARFLTQSLQRLAPPSICWPITAMAL